MRNWEAFKTHHKNQTRAALRRHRAMKPMQKGMRPGTPSSGSAVIYCDACHGPVVDSKEGRARHSFKSQECRAAMGL
jgi:hypothetical protein